MAVELQHVSKLLRLLSGEGDVPIPNRVWKVESQPLPDQESQSLPTTGGQVVMDRPKRDEFDLVTCDPRPRTRFLTER